MIERNEEETLLRRNDENAAPPPSLSRPLYALMVLNGVILSLPTTALLYMVNTYIQIPVSWIPSYISLSFLPYSLKPVYAYVSSSLSAQQPAWCSRNVQITALWISSGFFYIITAFLPARAMLLFFLLGGLRSLATAWPDFLLDWVLIEQAAAYSEHAYAATAAQFQSQAATARSVGCILAHGFVCLLFLLVSSSHSSHPRRTFQCLLILAGLCNFVSAGVTWHCGIGNASTHATDEDPVHAASRRSPERIGDASGGAGTERPDEGVEEPKPVRTPSYDSLESSSLPEEEAHGTTVLEIDSARAPLLPPAAVPTDPPNPVWLVVLLQTWIVLLTLRPCLALGRWVWTAVALLSLGLAYPWLRPTAWGAATARSLRVGVFLLLRYAVPSVSYLMTSYVYTAFQEHPVLIQGLSVLDMCTTTLSCWAYSKYLSRFSRGNELWWLMGITTALAGVASLGNVFLIRILHPLLLPEDEDDPHETHSPPLPSVSLWQYAMKIVSTVCINAVMTFFNEWKFLPDVVLATVSIDTTRRNHSEDSNVVERAFDRSRAMGLQYGTWMSCIDFGGQIGALLAGPLVVWLGTTRENHWQHLELLQAVNSILVLLSIGWLFLVVR